MLQQHPYRFAETIWTIYGVGLNQGYAVLIVHVKREIIQIYSYFNYFGMFEFKLL